MLNEHLFNQLKSIISDPAWQIVVKRIEEILIAADKKIHLANKDTFDYSRGYYDATFAIYNLLAEPKNLADDGVKKFGAPAEQEGG